jgi:hypothetical protein
VSSVDPSTARRLSSVKPRKSMTLAESLMADCDAAIVTR